MISGLSARPQAPDLSPAWASLLQLNPDGILVVSRSRGVEFANTAAERILGIDQAALQVRGFGGRAWDARGADGRPLRRREFPVIRALRTGRPVSDADVDIQRPDGSRAVLSINVAPFHREDGDLVVIGSVRDITAHRHAETRRNLAWEMVRALASSLDMDSTIETVAWLAIPGLAEASVVQLCQGGALRPAMCRHVDRERQQLLDEWCARQPDSRQESAADRVVQTGKPLLVPDLHAAALDRHMAPDEAAMVRQLEFTAALCVPLRARRETLGTITFYRAGGTFAPGDLGFAEELAGHAALAIDNARLLRDARASDRAKTDFLSVMSHEFRTPLTAIVGYAELMGMGVGGPLTEQQRQQVARIQSGAWHMTRLVDEVLTFTRLEAEREDVESRALDPGDAVAGAIELVRPMAEAKALGIHVEPPEVAVTISSDPHLLQQILVKLLGNAVKFTANGGVRVCWLQGPSEFRLEVQDTGVGIAPEHMERIFESFWQVDQGTTRTAGGVGLGLTIARQLAERLGGRLTAESTPGKGSRFIVTLPEDPPTQERGAPDPRDGKEEV
ncbi:MAG: ATP-binding protein [Gemmatimonadota bacterium]